MGAVYEAVDEQLERQVALKVLLREGDSALNQKRFLREARLAAKLTHPNIATVFEVGEFESNLYIVMELLEGQSLRKLLISQRLKTDEIFGIARDVARALARAHNAGVMHRDIKPENVFLTTPSPNVLHAKVLDFGLARQQKATPRPAAARNQEVTETTAGDLLGTPGYWSPEQARSGEVDARTDIFSFGIVLYEMITGRQAFKANSTVALVLAVTRHEPEPVRKYAPNVAPELEAIVARCIEKEPSRRFADGAELLEALEALARASARASIADVDDTSADADGPPVERRSDVPRPRASTPAIGAPTPGPTTYDSERGDVAQPVDRFRLFAAIGGGCAVAGILLIIVVAVLGRSDPPKSPGAVGTREATAIAASAAPIASVPQIAVVAPPPAPAPAPAPPEPAADPEPAATAIPMPLADPAVTMIPTPLATAVPVPTAAIATARTSPGSAGGAAAGAPARSRKADCAQPFTIDAKGVKIPKLHCL